MTTSLTVLGLDLGTTTGWAVVEVDLGGWKLIALGEERFKLTRFESAGMRFIRFRAWLGEMLHRARPDIVAYEEVARHKGTAAAHLYGGLMALVLSEVENRPGCECMGIPVGTVKKRATGKGNAGKGPVAEAAWRVARQQGVDGPESDDAADALFVALAAVDEIPVQPGENEGAMIPDGLTRWVPEVQGFLTERLVAEGKPLAKNVLVMLLKRYMDERQRYWANATLRRVFQLAVTASLDGPDPIISNGEGFMLASHASPMDRRRAAAWYRQRAATFSRKAWQLERVKVAGESGEQRKMEV